MSEDSSHELSEHAKAPPAAHATSDFVGSPPPGKTLDYSPSLLGDARLNGRGNAPVRIALMRQIQQTHGNRSLQRFLQRTATSRQTGCVGHAGTSASPTIQRYTTIEPKDQTKDNWEVGAEVRVSEDGNMAVAQADIAGSQKFWAEENLIVSASNELKGAESVITLRPAKGGKTPTLKGKAPDKSGDKTLKKVIARNDKTHTEGEGRMEIWADCGKAACDVAGGGKGTGSNNRVALFTNKTSKSVRTKPGGPARMKWEIMRNYFDDKIDQKKLGDLERELSRLKGSLSKEKDANKIEDYKSRIKGKEKEMEPVIFAPYNNLTADEKDKFDEKAGINRYAAPKVGQAYTISSGGAPKPGKKTWNFHWAGVVMKSGGDSVTLENYAVGDSTVKNTDWSFQMYGSATKKGQTFHEQHRDVHAQHGESPTTMAVEPE